MYGFGSAAPRIFCSSVVFALTISLPWGPGREKVSNLLTAYKKNAAGFGDQEERQHIRKLFARLGSY